MWCRWLLLGLAACGRIDFDPRSVAWMGTAVNVADTTPTTMFTLQAHAAGNAVLLHVDCDSTAMPSVAVTAPGWAFSQLGPVTGQPLKWATAFGAIAPDTAAVSAVVTWQTGACVNGDVLGDEFTNTAPMPFEATTVTAGSGDCATMVTTASPGAALWIACSSGGTITGVGNGFTKSADDNHDDWSAYKQTTDPAGTVEAGSFTTAPTGAFTITMTSLRSL